MPQKKSARSAKSTEPAKNTSPARRRHPVIVRQLQMVTCQLCQGPVPHEPGQAAAALTKHYAERPDHLELAQEQGLVVTVQSR